MIKHTNILILIFLLFSGRIFSQGAWAMSDMGGEKTPGSSATGLPVFEFKVYSNDNDLNAITQEMAGEHFLGGFISRKMYLLDSKYTYEVQTVPGNPQTRTMVRKPVIYDAVKKN